MSNDGSKTGAGPAVPPAPTAPAVLALDNLLAAAQAAALRACNGGLPGLPGQRAGLRQQQFGQCARRPAVAGQLQGAVLAAAAGAGAAAGPPKPNAVGAAGAALRDDLVRTWAATPAAVGTPDGAGMAAGARGAARRTARGCGTQLRRACAGHAGLPGPHFFAEPSAAW